MNLPKQKQILDALHQFEQESITSAVTAVEHLDPIDVLIASYGWEAIRDAVLAILHDKSQAELWEVAINALYSSISDLRQIGNVNYFIALMYACWKQFPGCNSESYAATIWSLVTILKKVDYNTEYEPLADSEITSIIGKITKRWI